MHSTSRIFEIVASILLVLFPASMAHAQGSLKTINLPQAGKIVYGPVDGQVNEAGAMGAVLRAIHSQFGDRPQVGKLFQVRGTESVAAFFSVVKRNQGNGQLAGLIIVTKVTSDRVEAAVVSDDASRFNSTLSVMMKTLFGVWHPLEAPPSNESPSAAPSGSGSSGTVASLKPYVLPDRSASVSLPEGWEVSPKSAGGTIFAKGPNDEIAQLGLTILASDPNNPNVARTMRMVEQGGLRNTAYANAIYYPYGADLQKTFVDLVHQLQTKSGMSQAAYKFTSVTLVETGPGQRCAHILGQVDFNDGKGPREFDALFCATPPLPASGAWLSHLYAISVPVKFADLERATLGAILQSFHVDMNVVNGQAAAYAAPSIAQTRAIGRAAAAQAAAAHQRNDIQNSSVYQHWDAMDKRSKEFSNYQLGYSVIQDNQANAHGTFWNEDADALVKHDPQRYEYVNAPNFWKGIDY